MINQQPVGFAFSANEGAAVNFPSALPPSSAEQALCCTAAKW